MESQLEDLIYYGGEVKALGDGKVGGYLVRFSGPDDPDLEGEFFSASTDFGDAETSPVLYHHGMDGRMGKRTLGKGSLRRDDVGIWIEAQLAMRDEYERAVYELAESGKLGWSSGTAGHLVEYEQIGKAMHIKAWPLGLDASLTPTPAEPRNAAMPLKSLTPVEEPAEAPESAPVKAAEEPTVTITELPVYEESVSMDEELKTQIGAYVADAVKAAMAEINQPAAIVTGGAPAVTKNPRKSAAFGTAMLAWLQGDNPEGFTKSKDMPLIKGAWEGGTDNEGGYAVPDGFVNRIYEIRGNASWVRQAPVTRIVTDRDRILLTNEATAAAKLTVTDEEAAYTESEDVFGQPAVTIYKFTRMLKISEEMLSGDAPGIEEYLAKSIAKSSAGAENYYLTVGSGTGMPQGILTGATASGVTSASATAVTAAELAQTIGSVDTVYHTPDSGLLMTGATKWYLRSLTGNPFQFVPTPEGNGDFMGFPAFLSPDMESIAATKKPILFGDFSQYVFAENGGLVISRNPWLYQANGQIGVFVKARFGGAVMQTTAFKYLTQHS